ncbi:MAG: VCBS repeat-containing protein, partial [Bacteroidota bacterium]
LASLDRASASVRVSSHVTKTTIDDIVSGTIEPNGRRCLYISCLSDRTISVLLRFDDDTVSPSGVLHLPFPPSHCIEADFNNDGKSDLLVFDSKTPGIQPYIGDGRGNFRPGKIIAPDNAVEALACAFFNNDNILDMILYDWVKGELHVLYGVGHGRFIDQSTFPVQEDVNEISVIPATANHPLRMLLLMKKSLGLQTWEGNDFGDFKMIQHNVFNSLPQEFSAADLSGSDMPEYIFMTDSSLVNVSAYDDTTGYLPALRYGAGPFVSSLLTIPSYQGGKENVLVWDDRQQMLTLLLPGDKSFPLGDSVFFAAGVFPTDIIVQKNISRTAGDIIATDEVNNSLVWLSGQQGSVPLGAVMHSISDSPHSIAFHSRNDSVTNLLVAYPDAQKLAFISIAANGALNEAVIPSEGRPEFLSVKNKALKNDNVIALNMQSSTIAASLSFYERLEPSEFIERTFRLSSPAVLLGAAVDDLNRDSIPDIVYAYRSADTAAVELGIALGDSALTMVHRIFMLDFHLPETDTIDLWLTHLSRRDTLDLLFYSGAPFYQLWCARGKGDSVFADPVLIVPHLILSDRSQLKIIDVDQDGRNDIVVLSEADHAVVWFRATGDCTFDSGTKLSDSYRDGHFAIGDIDGDGINDLVLTSPHDGFVKIVNGAVWLRQRKTAGNK